MKPTLLILAAGIGSRYGGVKQMDKIGPSGESIIDYSIYDAIRAGFGKVVFVLNSKIEKDFKEVYEKRLAGKIETGYVIQELTNVPEGIDINPDRVKPWGTAHAVLVAKDIINEPMAVLNADDFYGKEAFSVLGGFLADMSNDSTDYAMVGYKLANTLSENGTVSRGICKTSDGFLTDVVERTSIARDGSKIYFDDNGAKEELDGYALVSMNLWGFSPAFFQQTEADFRRFIADNANELKAEFYIPFVVNNLINNNEATLKMLTSNDQWFGVTYKEDKEATIANVSKLISDGVYPERLW